MDSYREVPEYTGRGRSPTLKKPCADWQYIQAIKERDDGKAWQGTGGEDSVCVLSFRDLIKIEQRIEYSIEVMKKFTEISEADSHPHCIQIYYWHFSSRKRLSYQRGREKIRIFRSLTI